MILETTDFGPVIRVYGARCPESFNPGTSKAELECRALMVGLIVKVERCRYAKLGDAIVKI